MVNPVAPLQQYFARLSGAFGWRYVAAVMLTYGGNQGMGEAFVFGARTYFMQDDMGLNSAAQNQLEAAVHIPWDLKSLFGVISDTVPIHGLHRGPYMLISGVLGVAAMLLITLCRGAVISSYGLAALVFTLANLNFAMPDVMIDATVAARGKERPELMASLQALCWASLGVCQIPVYLSSGYLLQWGGTGLMFGCAIGTATFVTVPPLLGWLGERRRHRAGSTLHNARVLCAATWSHPTKSKVVGSATIVGVYSIVLGVVQNLELDPTTKGYVVMGGGLCLCVALYTVLRRVDPCLARAVVFAFLKGAMTPRSRIMFEWAHEPVSSHDHRCWSAQRCASALANATAALAANTTADALPCGWASARGRPCIEPVVYGYVQVAGAAALAVGTALYTSAFQTWRYKSIFAVLQLCLCLANLIDFLWVMRFNLAIGLPDTLMVFGEEVFIDVFDAMQSQPFFIFAAKLCPPDVEASMFALFMGLSNFGSSSGRYLGSFLLDAFGGVHAPAFANLEGYVLCRSLMRLGPILAIPFLVPNGTPADSAKEMGAGSGVTTAATVRTRASGARLVGGAGGARVDPYESGGGLSPDASPDEAERTEDGVELGGGGSAEGASDTLRLRSLNVELSDAPAHRN